MRRTLLPLLLAACGAPAGDTAADTDSDSDTPADPWAGHPILTTRIANVAHRGGAALWPEETILAFTNADAAGADMLELDVWATLDGHLVLNHDESVDRTTDGTGTIRSMTFEQVRALDAGYRFTADDGATYPYRGQGVRIAELSEVLEAFPHQLFNLEIKQQSPRIIEPVLEAISAAGLHDRVAVTAFDDAVLQDVRAVDPTILTALGTGEGVSFYYLPPEQEGAFVPSAPFFAAPLSYAGITLAQSDVERAHRLGIRALHVWTIDDPAEMDTVLDWGVDGVITDDPVTLEAKLQERGLAP